MKNNPIEAIIQEVESRGRTAGMLRILTANETIAEALKSPDPVDLYHGLVFEGEVTCLFADTGVGKTVFAVQIAEEIAKRHVVLYADFELSDKQFQLRYTGSNGQVHTFPNNFYRAELNRDILETHDFENIIIKNLEAAAASINASVVIIDNLTYLCNAAEKGESASELMKKILSKKKQGWTVIVIAHTPKRSLYCPISENDLAGSKRLMNFFDAAFCIGKSAKDLNLRYIKQIKVRSGEIKYGPDDVLLCQFIRTEDNALRLEIIGSDTERNHLRRLTGDEIQEQEESVIELHHNGYSFREIQDELGISKSTIGRIIKAHENGKNE